YGGSTPSPAYPAVTYPVIPNALGINVTGQYSKVTSSRIQIDHCKVTNFIVGIVQQPSGVEANGDFIKTTHTSVNNCKYGISSSGGQARLSEISNCNLDTCWILVTNSVHGAQRGRINLIQNTHFSGYQMLQFIETAWNNQLILRDCYCESTFKIGYFGANRTNACNLTIDNCDLNFDHSKGVPSVLVQTGSFAKITIKGGRIVSGPTLLASFGKIELNGVSVTIDCTASIGLAGNNITTWSNFLTFTCGLPAMSAFYPGKDMKDCLLGVNGLSADLTATGIGNAVGYEGSADFNTDPAHVIGGYFDNTGHLGSTYRLSTGPGVGNYPTGAMFSARVLTIPSNYLFSSRLVSVSDCLVDRSNSTLWLVLSTNATTTVLLLLNGFQLNSDMSVNFYETPSIVTSPISTTGNDAVMHTGFNRNYAMATGTDGQLALIGDCTSGTALISNITSANGLSGPVAGQFACIDASKFLYVYLISGTDPTVRTSSWQGPFRVVSINTTTFQMQLDANINGITGKVYLFNASLYQ
ncbi:MAG: hypothetical protein JWP37_3633, partial [Mucilaginibacter sp.]|nr:hypothetical protein [Mucilaginibacter sp.]